MVLVQERLHDSRAGKLTHSLQPILPQNPNCRSPLAKWVPKPIQRHRAPKLRRDPEGGQLGFTAPFKKCRCRFSRTYSPVSRRPCRHQRWTPLAPLEGRSSLTDTKDLPTFPNLLASRPGLPLRLSVTAKRRISTQHRSRLVAAWQGYRTLGEAHQLRPHRQALITLSFRELKQQSQTHFGITVWASPVHEPGVLNSMCCLRRR